MCVFVCNFKCPLGFWNYGTIIITYRCYACLNTLFYPEPATMIKNEKLKRQKKKRFSDSWLWTLTLFNLYWCSISFFIIAINRKRKILDLDFSHYKILRDTQTKYENKFILNGLSMMEKFYNYIRKTKISALQIAVSNCWQGFTCLITSFLCHIH